MVTKVVKEINRYISELGVEGRLISMQMEELVASTEDEWLLVIQDYAMTMGEITPADILNIIRSWPAEDILDLAMISRALGYPNSPGILDQHVMPRGYRILDKIPRLPLPVIENMIKAFGTLSSVLVATIEELDGVEGIGEVRARSIKEGLDRLREQVMQ